MILLELQVQLGPLRMVLAAQFQMQVIFLEVQILQWKGTSTNFAIVLTQGPWPPPELKVLT